jgi:aldoxime dehydratase
VTQDRSIPSRRPDGFVPAVQRWSAHFPPETGSLYVAYSAVQAKDEAVIAGSSFIAWAKAATQGPVAPAIVDHGRFTDKAGRLNHVVIGYWSDKTAFDRWAAEQASWWDDPARLGEATGYWREWLDVPLDRQETIYFKDFPAGLARLPTAMLEKTPESGYWGAMRERIPLARTDALLSSAGTELVSRAVPSEGRRIRIAPPGNLAVIRSGQMWEWCGKEQLDEYFDMLKPRLEQGMAYLKDNAQATGCCDMRYMRHCDAEGAARQETSVNSLFLTLADMERWSEHHPTHKAIFGEAIRQVMKYKDKREFRTWHEVFVLPAQGQLFEYLNCHPETGLLPFFA